MTIPDKFLLDEQDPKAIDKVLVKLTEMLSSNEELIYIAVQKKPAVNLLPDCIAISNKRIFYCEPGNFGITMNFKDISWKSIHEVSFKEELFGSKFTCTPIQGVPIVTDFIPKVQARKLYQAAYEQLENYREQQQALNAAQNTKEPSKTGIFQDTEQFEDAVIIDQAELPEAEIPSAGVAPESTFSSDPISTTSSFSAPVPAPDPEDETTLKLRKLKSLYDKQLITLEEYEAKKAAILDSF
jgi:hypothetical protein